MARAGQTEPDSVSIWLKLSGEDAARMTQVLARPEFAGWTRAEWCLEMIQTALGYYTRPRPTAEPGRAPAADATAQPEAAAAESVPAEPAAAEPAPVAAEPAAAESAAPGLVPDEPEARVDDKAPADEPELVADELERPAQAECPHPADARDYQSGTCAACGAILWD
jgi:nicotinate-nucleotide--dimethylbenzimidazole phosphoribosyltransferase